MNSDLNSDLNSESIAANSKPREGQHSRESKRVRLPCLSAFNFAPFRVPTLPAKLNGITVTVINKFISSVYCFRSSRANCFSSVNNFAHLKRFVFETVESKPSNGNCGGERHRLRKLRMLLLAKRLLLRSSYLFDSLNETQACSSVDRSPFRFWPATGRLTGHTSN